MIALDGWALLEPEEKKKDGDLFLPDSAKTETQRGTVVELPESKFYVNNGCLVDVPEKLSVGAKVIYKKYHAQNEKIDGKEYAIVPINQIAVIL